MRTADSLHEGKATPHSRSAKRESSRLFLHESDLKALRAVGQAAGNFANLPLSILASPRVWLDSACARQLSACARILNSN
jgi:hypothetical protein